MNGGMGNEEYERLRGSIGVLEWGWVILGWMGVSWCVLYLVEWDGWMGWLNGELMEWFVIVRDSEWNGWIWIWWRGMSIECYVWSAEREWLIDDEEEDGIECWIWLEFIDGCEWRGMEFCGWGLRRNALYVIPTWIWWCLIVNGDSRRGMVQLERRSSSDAVSVL